jgi:RNA polymerase sigma factor (sigma-70 family)
VDDRWDEVFRKHAHALRKAARRMADNDNDAEDLVHETIERYIKREKNLKRENKMEVVDERAFLMRILGNLIADIGRGNGKVKRLLADEGVAKVVEPSSSISIDDLKETWGISETDLYEAVNQLSEPQRDAVRLFLEGLSVKQLAKELEITPQTAAKRLFDARSRLRELISPAEALLELLESIPEAERQDLLDQLPAPLRNAARLIVEGLTLQEIAKALNIPLQEAARRIFATCAKLRALLKLKGS